MQSVNRRKSLVHHQNWVSIILLGMGLVFLSIAIIVQLIPMDPENLHVVVNGVPQPATENSVRTFRLIFLLAFGLVGLGLSAAGMVQIWRGAARKRMMRFLLEEGIRVTAQITDVMDTNVRVNGHSLLRLRCAYTDSMGKTYLFKSGPLRMDPLPYLPDGLVEVYYDPQDMSRYFVDVDSSMGLGTKVIEL